MVFCRLFLSYEKRDTEHKNSKADAQHRELPGGVLGCVLGCVLGSVRGAVSAVGLRTRMHHVIRPQRL